MRWRLARSASSSWEMPAEVRSRLRLEARVSFGVEMVSAPGFEPMEGRVETVYTVGLQTLRHASGRFYKL